MSKEKQLAKNTIIIAISKFFTSLLGFFLLPLYTHFLSAGEYGTADLVLTYGALIAPIVILRTEIAVFRWLVDVRKDIDATKDVITSVLSMLTVILVIFCGIYLATSLFVDIPYWQYILLYIISMALSSIILQISRGIGDNKIFAIGSIITGVVTMIASVVLLVLFGWKVEGVLFGMTLGFLAGVFFVLWKLRLHKYIARTGGQWKMQKELLKFSLPMIPNTLSWWIVNASDRTIISSVIGLAANGIYAVSSKFAAIGYGFYGIFDLAWSESAVLYIDAPDRDKFFSKVMNKVVQAFGAACILLLAAIPFVFPILVNSEFSEALLYIPVLLLGILGDILSRAYGNIYIAKKMSKKVMSTTILAAVVNIIVIFALIWFIGLWAAAISTAIAYLVLVVYRHFDVKRFIKITYGKHVFFAIITIFMSTAALYYWNNFYGNIINLVIAVIAAYLLNKNTIGFGWKMLRKKFAK